MKKLLSILMLSMILFGCSNNQPQKTITKRVTKRVLVDELIDKGTQEISSFYYESELFNGIAFDVYPNGKLSQEYTVKNGVIDGLYKTYYENGKLKQEGNYRNGQLVRTETNTKPVKIVPPKATEIKKMKKKEIISDIYIGKPIKSKQEDYGTAARIQLNDDFAEVVEIQEFIADDTVKMGIITDVKQELRKANALKINYSTQKRREQPKKEVIVEEDQKVNQQAMYSKKTTVTFEGRNDADLGDLGNGGNGNEYQLGNRNPIVLPKPIYDSEAEEKVVVHIIVDQSGDVISAITDIGTGTTLNKQLLDRAKEAALKTKYPPKADAPNQHGKLIYTFQKN